MRDQPAKHKFIHVKFDPDLLDPNLLRDDIALEIALATLEGHFSIQPSIRRRFSEISL